MVDAIVKNIDKQNIHPVSVAKNIFDSNGINLENHLEMIYSELFKRDVKRVYFEISDITDKENPSTYEILTAMADNTIAMLAIENDSYLVNEIGSRLGGVLILCKKTSVYFSCGMFFTYRYGETYTGSSGVGGTSFIWSRNTNTIHSLHSGEVTTLGAVKSYQKISEWGGQAINPRLSEVNGTITIPKGVHRIMVSAYVVIESVEDGDKFMSIFVNGSQTNIMAKTHAINNATLSLTPLILSVNENDEIDLRIYSNSLDRLRAKHFTIEVID